METIEYAAPEQFGYAQTDERSDIYSLGVMFSEIQMEENAPFLKVWKRLIDKSTCFDPVNRYRSVSELKKKVEKCLRKAKSPFGLHTVLSVVRNLGKNIPEPEGNKGVSNGRRGTAGECEEFVFGNETGVISFTANQCSCVEALSATYHTNTNGSVSIRYERYLGEVKLEFPNPIDLKYCREIVLKMKNDVGKLTVKFYDSSGDEIFALYTPKTQGVEEVSFWIQEDCKVTRIGFLADDDTLAEYSGFETIFYGIRFLFLAEETETLTCWFNEMTPGEYYNAEYSYLDDGRLHVTYADLYGEVRLALPQPVDLSRCIAVTIRLKSRVGRLNVKLYDADYDAYHAAEATLMNIVFHMKKGKPGYQAE